MTTAPSRVALRAIALVAVLATLLVLPAATATHAQATRAQAERCALHARFGALRGAVGAAITGVCVERPWLDDSGDLRQRTSRGEFIVRQSDGHAAFTDGNDTWLIGPAGARRRPNDEQFFWEAARSEVSPAMPLAITDAELTDQDAPAYGVASLDGPLLPDHRIVTYYGNPLSDQMGILGELEDDRLVARVREQAAAYELVDPTRPVLPALELVAVVAQAGPGSDGMYRLRMDTDLIEDMIGLAERNDLLLILDVQIGRSNVQDEVRAMLPFLKRRNVHLALDPEFAMTQDQLPGRVIGSHSAAEVNLAIDLVADLVAAEGLPPKLLVVHRFTEKMLTDADKIRRDPRVQVVVVMDGFGPPEVKTNTYDTLVRDQGFEHLGFKLFYKQDVPLMTPAQVLELDPSLGVIIYQ